MQQDKGTILGQAMVLRAVQQDLGRCEMLIGGDDISNDVITLGTCFSMFVYIRAGPSFS